MSESTESTVTWTSERDGWGNTSYHAVINGVRVEVRKSGSSRPTVTGRWKAIAIEGVASRTIARTDTMKMAKHVAEINLKEK